MEHAQITNN